MSKHKHKTPTPAAEPTTEAATHELVAQPAASVDAEPESLVDDVFDVVTGWVTQGLGLASRGLEISARWLDERAKLVGDLARKLESTSRRNASPTATPSAPAPASAHQV